MNSKIEMGSFNRSPDSPILLKEKIEGDGSVSVRIYQRKDIDSITSLKDKIKTMVKYGIEDFFMANDKFRPLLKTIGIKRIEPLKINDHKEAQDLLQSIRSEARTGGVTQEKELKLKQILSENGISENYKIDFYEGKYTHEDFFSDLKKFISKENFSGKEIEYLDEINADFISKNILPSHIFQKYEKFIDEIKSHLGTHFQKQKQWQDSQPDKSINLDALETEINKKLTEIITEIKQRSFTPTDEDIKNHLLSSAKSTSAKNNIFDEEAEKMATEIRATIRILFSTHWWVSEERKMESLKKVQDFFDTEKLWLPEPVCNRIYPKPQPIHVPATIGVQPDTNPYVSNQK